MNKILTHIFLFIGCLIYFIQHNVAYSNAVNDLLRLQKAYPEQIIKVTPNQIIWADGSVMALDHLDKKKNSNKLTDPSLRDQVQDVEYPKGIPEFPENFKPQSDPGRIRYEPFFLKMYGNSPEAVKSKLTTIYWMPHYFQDRFPLLVTTVNHIDQKFLEVSKELEKLVHQHPEYLVFLENPAGTFCWRTIANTNRLSLHSFGMTIDINVDQSNYWQWDLKKAGLAFDEDSPLLSYQNHIPWKIVEIFEKYGFIWGGKWEHYDTMHFEYRPELLIPSENQISKE